MTDSDEILFGDLFEALEGKTLIDKDSKSYRIIKSADLPAELRTFHPYALQGSIYYDVIYLDSKCHYTYNDEQTIWIHGRGVYTIA